VLEAEPADRLLVEGLKRIGSPPSRVASGSLFSASWGSPVFESQHPSHMGLGSGTQLALAVGTALARLGGLELDVTEMAVTMRRGIQSGIGIATFQHGGFVLDGGHRVTGDGEAALAPVGARVPPVLFHHPVPEDWYFVTVLPAAKEGFSGEREQLAFETLPPAPPTSAEKISRLLLMKMLPALVERDIASFGQALTEIQQLVGDSFAAVQGSRYANALSERLVDFLLDQGAAGAGQSSWGPAVYAIVEGEDQALLLESKVCEFLASHGEGQTFCTRADNRGARVRQVAPRDTRNREFSGKKQV